MKIYKTGDGLLLSDDGSVFRIDATFDDLLNQPDLYAHLKQLSGTAQRISNDEFRKAIETSLLAPIGSQEVWAAGVTYLRSRDARMEESKESGGATFYDKVYEAERPELFFKSMPHRVVGSGQAVFIRRDSTWNVPEPELTLMINRFGTIVGYTIGNDMSSRSIEGENPLYLPQAKMYERSASIGPCIYVPDGPITRDTVISMEIFRGEKKVFYDSVQIDRIKRSFAELAEFLYREFDFPAGCFLMTGTCLVPPDDFTLAENDRVEISIDGIGTLINTIAFFHKPNHKKPENANDIRLSH
jgi:2-dehydro-3-deoxy-D-arabinonate dehydratase